MGRTIKLELSRSQKAALENATKYGTTPSYRLRCQAVLKKAEGNSVRQIAQELACCLSPFTTGFDDTAKKASSVWLYAKGEDDPQS
jgi:hypothetical protein